jgi:uncharacterized damage-inducible protein DinB
MHTAYEAILDRLDELHRSIRETLNDLPAEALDWSPAPEMNSLSVLIVHLAGAERYWVGDVVQGIPSFRDRDAEFRAKGLSAGALAQRITDLESYERLVLGNLDLASLEEERISPRDGRRTTVAWALSHALEHTAIHVGHIQILSQLWKQRPGGLQAATKTGN